LHEASLTLLVIEVKSVVPDVQATLSTLDRKGRLGAEIAAIVGWRPRTIARLLVINASRTSRRRVAAHAATFDAALPDRLGEVRRFLADPAGARLRGTPDPARAPLRGLIFLTGSPQAPVRHRQPARRQQVRA